MGVVATARSAATRVAKAPPKRVGRQTISTSTNISDIEGFLNKFPIELRNKVLTKAVRATGKIVADAAKAKAPSSDENFTRDKWSSEVRRKRGGRIDDLRRSIKTRVRQYDSAVAGFVGPTWPSGAHGWIVEHGAMIQLWGEGQYALYGEPFLRPAAMETASKQDNMMITSVKNQWQQV